MVNKQSQLTRPLRGQSLLFMVKMEKYKPTNKEVLNELLNSGKQKLNNIINDSLENLAILTETAANVATLPYTLPSIRRRTNSFGKENSTREKFFKVSGFCLGVFSYCIQIPLYWHYAQEGHPEILAMPAVTNIASYGYERWQGAKQRLIENNAIDHSVEK